MQGDVEDGDLRWIMTAMRSPTSGERRNFKRRVSDAWTVFTDLLKVPIIGGFYQDVC